MLLDQYLALEGRLALQKMYVLFSYYSFLESVAKFFLLCYSKKKKNPIQMQEEIP